LSRSPARIDPVESLPPRIADPPRRLVESSDDDDDDDPCAKASVQQAPQAAPTPPAPDGAAPVELAPVEPTATAANEVNFERPAADRAPRRCAKRLAAGAARGLQPCFERSVLSGRYDVSFQISGDGRASSVKVTGQGVDDELITCIRAMLGPLRFPKFTGSMIYVDAPVHVQPAPPEPEPPAPALPADGGAP
jgi:hypothetical protein